MSSDEVINIISLLACASTRSTFSLSLWEWWSNIFKNPLACLRKLTRISLHTVSLVAWSLAASLLRPLHQVMNIIVIGRLRWSSHKFRLNTTRLWILLTGSTRCQQELLVTREWITPCLYCKIIRLWELLLHTMSLKPRCYTKIILKKKSNYLLLSDLSHQQMISSAA